MKTQRVVLGATLIAALMTACTHDEPPPDGPYDGCIQEGEEMNAKIPGAACCEGLTRIEDTQYRDGGICEPVPPDLKICTRCGNGQCGPGESPCNCPADCR
jgi:hypothetical protein